MEKRETSNVTVQDVRSTGLENYDRDLYKCFDTKKKDYQGIFYIVSTFRKDPVSGKVNTLFWSRNSCPTPQFDQSVYQCHKDWSGPLFMWTLPSEEYALALRENAYACPPEQYQLLRFVLDYYNGTLLHVAKKLSNETEETGQLIIES